MPKVNIIQSSFTGGELSPRLAGRVDFDTYEKSAKEITNAYPLIHGGLKSRNGTVMVGEITNYSVESKLIPFTNSIENSFVLLFANGKLQIIKDKAFIETSPNVKYELNIPYLDSELVKLDYAQAGNVLFLTHPNHPPKELIRNSDTDWIIRDILFDNGALADFWYESDYLKFKIIAGNVDFKVGDGFLINVNSSGTITSYKTKTEYAKHQTSTGGATNAGSGELTNMEVNIPNNPGAGEIWHVLCTIATKDRWEFEVDGTVSIGHAISTWSPNNYPNSVSFFNQRLIFGGSPKFPQHIWASTVGDYTNFLNGPLDADAWTAQIASNKFDQVKHLEATRALIPLSHGAEFSITGSSKTGITGNSAKIQAHTFHGSSDVKPLRIGQEILFVPRSETKVRAISYDVNIDANVAPDITVLAEHITKSGIKNWAFAQDPDYLVWAVRNDGEFLSLAHDRDQGITAWARHVTEGNVKDVISIPDGTSDVLYFVVEREINGSTKYFLEFFNEHTYTDCAIHQHFDIAEDVITGLDHLEGKTVDVRVDSRNHPPRVVINGQITLTSKRNDVEVGLNFKTTIVLLHPEVKLPTGTIQGTNISITEAILRVQDSVEISVDNKLYPTGKTDMNLDEAPVPFTGDIVLKNIGWDKNRNLIIEHKTAMPFQLLAVILKLAVGEN